MDRIIRLGRFLNHYFCLILLLVTYLVGAGLAFLIKFLSLPWQTSPQTGWGKRSNQPPIDLSSPY